MPTYAIVAPEKPGPVSNQSDSTSEINCWMNGVYVGSSGVITNRAVTSVDPDNTAQGKYSLVSSEVGYYWMRSNVEYGLAEVVTPPENVDWNATAAAYNELVADGKDTGFLLNPDGGNSSVYAVVGGTKKFDWILKDGTTNTVSYKVASTCKGRPRRIYWTDSPYNAPAVSLAGKFVKIIDPNGICAIERGTVTNDIGGVQTISEDTVKAGIYLDETTQVLYAKGQRKGQFILAYYDTGSYENILSMEVIEVCEPVANVCKGVIGQPLEPSGMGYDTDGLVPQVTAGIGDADDDLGDYLYQHAGQESYSAKNGCVFPIRPSVGKRWKQEIYWMETDPMGVKWPFELDQYESDWPKDGCLFVRGDKGGDTGAKVYIPVNYTAKLQSYQEPLGHALQVTGNNVFETTGEGWSLLKLTANDNVWFLPIHSVNRSNAEYFTLEERTVAVGREFRLRSGSESGIAPGASEIAVATADAPGYVYRAASKNVYNVDLYRETTKATDPKATQTSVDGAFQSKIFAVNESTDAIEVWWSRRVQQDDMPYWIDIPCLPQRYVPVWPDATEAPTIVIASEKGSAGESLFEQNGALTFDRSNSRADLMPRRYFPGGAGTISFWTRRSKDRDPVESVTNEATALVSLGNADGRYLSLRVGYEENLEMLLDGETSVTNVPMPVLARPNEWTHIALAISEGATKYTLFTNGAEAAQGALENASFLGETLTKCVVGRVMETAGDVQMPEITDNSAEPEPTASSVTFTECETFAQMKEAFGKGQSVKLTKDVSNDLSDSSQSNTISIAKSVTLDLNGHSLTFDSNYRLFEIVMDGKNICTLSICDSSSGGKGYISHKNSSVFRGGGKIASVTQLGKLVLENGTLLGNGTSDLCPLVSIDSRGSVMTNAMFVMTGGTVRNGRSARYGGGVMVNNGTFQLDGGTVQGCHADNGGGVAVQHGAQFVMNGGAIDGCSADSLGGGVYSVGHMIFNGGRIINNTARVGGGVDASGAYSDFLFNKGLIATNVAWRADAAVSDNYCYGGGIALQRGAKCIMNGGFIVANEARGTEGATSANVPRWAAVGGESSCTFTMNAGGIIGNVCEAETTKMGTLGGTIVLKGGILDFEPTEANVNADETGEFDQPYYMSNPAFGIHRISLGTAAGRQIAELTMRSTVLDAEKVAKVRYQMPADGDADVTGYYSFRSDEAAICERTLGWVCESENVSVQEPGSPAYGSYVFAADAAPSVYYQNYAAQDGYNPNEEHAFVTTGAAGYVAWALRSDLNTAASSAPGVLVQYVKNGETKMQVFHVAATNEVYSTFEGVCTVAEKLPMPGLFAALGESYLPETFWDADPAKPGMPGVAYRDRKGALWARCAGVLPIHAYYRLKEGFFFPQYAENAQPAVGTAVPWLALYANPAADPITGRPAVWTWTAQWPETYSELKIGQTLYEASGDMPAVRSMKSASVIYPSTLEEASTNETVALIDPTGVQSVDFDVNLLKELGLTTESNGGLDLRNGLYYFTELPPNLSSRIWVDAANNKLCFRGKYDEKSAGVSILYLNVLTSNEHNQVANVVPESMRSGTAWKAWQAAAKELGKRRVEPNAMTATANELKTTYGARDSYALAAVGNTNWVVLVENDAPVAGALGVAEGDAINMHVFKVVPKYYEGRIVTKEDEQNLLSQRLSVLYAEGMGGVSDMYEFQWRSASPAADGTIPEDYEDEYTYVPRTLPYADASMAHITIGDTGDTLNNMVDKYWICRYRARGPECPAYEVMGDEWSEWIAPPAFAEGWVRRVLNNVTPFNQLMTDLYENEAETAVSMIQKAGKPYTGDVVINQDTVSEHGFIEIYETLLNKIESMSLLVGLKDADANKELLLCAERLGDMYTVLGDEAYTDAKNPTIGFGSDNVDYGSASSGLFCFDNQVRTLLDEELTLLRGRTGESAPVLTTAPYYNRLPWNFTKSNTAGEVAYAVNYNISGTETTAISEERAAQLYPQGHGDAYGHYLSALKGWYRLMRNPNFNWARAQGETKIDGQLANVDYYEEAKVAEAALKVAKVAAEVVDLTARKMYDDDGEKMAGYRDEVEDRAFGYGEWANRGAYGALVNWAVANSLLPEDETTCTTGTIDGVTAVYADSSLMRIDRGTVDELAEICTQAAAIQSAEDRIDSGLNPLGLDPNTIPFDISPIGVNDGTKTHYEQIRERAGTAVANARTILDRAQEYSNRLRMIQEGSEDYEEQIEEQERTYTQELIAYYGTPYSDDIGVGKTYAEGYDGPDTVHYQWMDLDKFDLADLAQNTGTYQMWTDYSDIHSFSDMLAYYTGDYEGRTPVKTTVTVELSSAGVVVKPANVTGTRQAQGSIQEKYADFLLKYKEYTTAIAAYNTAKQNLDGQLVSFGTLLDMQTAKAALDEINAAYGITASATTYASDKQASELGTTIEKAQTEYLIDALSANMTTIAGTAMGANAKAMAYEVTEAAAKAKTQAEAIKEADASNASLLTSYISTLLSSSVSSCGTAISALEFDMNYSDKVKDLISAINTAAASVQTKARELNVCIEAYKSEIAKAEQILELREANRKKYVSKIAKLRYNDMFFRQLRSQALSRYTASFDLAQKYVWEAAKVYGYETGMIDDDGSAETFLNQIIASRSLGSFGSDGNSVVGDTGDTGLAGLLAQLDANWLVLKPRLGINNPQSYATWFSLRSGLFRILSGAEGDQAWAKELTKHWTDDIKSNADFIRYCQPFQSQFGLKDKEPGIVMTFETTIDFGKNFFGQDLDGENGAYDSSWYATRIYAAGLWLEGYNAKANGYTGSAKLASTPVAYLVPIGADCLRAPGLENGSYLEYSVVDQVIAAPYTIGSSYLNDLSWFPNASDGDLGGADATTKIRKHPSFRAYFDTTGGAPTDAALDCTRLVGRSVWNTKWMLVIPAGSMNADRDKALSIFINGSDENRDGAIDLLPVSDIKIGFKTYSNSGN